MRVYIASPFFSVDQLNTVIKIENTLEKLGIDYYSPRHDGVLKDMSKKERIENATKIFQLNIDNMNRCNVMIANIDDKDLGTTFEMGYFYQFKKQIISFSANNWTINIMLKNSVVAHVNNFEDLSTVLIQLKEAGTLTTDFLNNNLDIT